MRKLKTIIAGIFVLTGIMACSEKDYLVTIHTPYGDMDAVLFDETAQHKENFIKLAKSGQFDSTTFHRIIKNFMIQGGDINALQPKSIDYTVPAEFVEGMYHVKGVLAAARQGDQSNPEKASSGSQFYIVQGRLYEEAELDEIESNQNLGTLQRNFSRLLRMDKYQDLRSEVLALQQAGDNEGIMNLVEESKDLIEAEFGSQKVFSFSEEQKKLYTRKPGSPHLDGEYTVFGKVVSGLHVIDSIAAVPTNRADKPLKDIPMTITLQEMSKRKLDKTYQLDQFIP